MRLQAILGEQSGSLASCEHVVLDECDKLLSEEFLEQVLFRTLAVMKHEFTYIFQIDDVFAAITFSDRRIHMFRFALSCSPCSLTDIEFVFSATMLPRVEDLANSSTSLSHFFLDPSHSNERAVMRDPLRIVVGARNTVVKTIEQKLVYCGTPFSMLS